MALKDFYIIGQEHHAEWSPGYDAEEFLKVLPNPNITLPYKSAWQEWQKGQADYKKGKYTYKDPNGLYYSSWGPDSDVVELELELAAFNELEIPGLGKLIANNTSNETSYDDDFQFYNGKTGSSHGPLIVVDPGDTIKIKLVNNLPEDDASIYYDDTNLHTHGLHVSATGNSDNVLVTIDSGETWETEIKVPDDHFVGPDWYHPHLHGATNVQVSKGLAGPLLIQPSTEETDDLDNFNPVTDPVYWMSLQTWGLNQEERSASSTDPVNQDPSGTAYRIATPPEFSVDADGQRTYHVSEAEYIAYNFMPNGYSPESPGTGSSPYGYGLNGTPIENIIHTVNGQLNPTIEAKVGEWNLFGFLNFAVNSHHVIQLVREHEGKISLEEFELVAVDGDVAGAAKDGLQKQTETPLIAPGARMTVQHAFTKPGKYYFLSNGTDEILGENLAPDVANTDSKSSATSGDTYYGVNDGHLVWGPQVLATVNVTGEKISKQPDSPEPWDYIKKEQAEIDQWMKSSDKKLSKGKLKQREFVWSAMDTSYFDDPGAFFSQISDNDPQTFEGAYRINGRYFGHTPQEQSVVAMPMLGTTEEWTIENTSESGTGIWGEWHPFHIHQNDFIVTEINGLSTDEISAYPSNQLADTVVLGGTFIDGTQNADNPYGQAAGPDTKNAQSFSTKIRMRFEDFPGAYVNHCHILFHEDAGMMQAVKVILNTDSTILGPDQASGTANLTLGNETSKSFQLKPYQNDDDNANFNLAIGDINYGKFFGSDGLNNNANYHSGTKGFSDNITDVATIQKSKDSGEDFTIRIFDGDAVKQAATGVYKFSGFAPVSPDNLTSVVINEDAGLKQLGVESDIYLKKKSSNPDNHEGTGGPGTWGISRFKGTTYIQDVYYDDGSYDWNANTDPSELSATNGDTIPSSYPIGGFTFSSADGSDSLSASEYYNAGDKDGDGYAEEHYTITDGTGRFEGVTSGEIMGSENFWGGADITLATTPESTIQANPQELIDGTDDSYILKDITPFKDVDFTSDSESSIAVGDIDGDGYSDIIAGLGGGNLKPVIEVYSGSDYSLMAKINPFQGNDKTSINLAAGDINSDNFVDILVGQGEGGQGLVHAFDGRSIFESIQSVNPLDGNVMRKATELFTDDFQPFGDYSGAVDVASGYINPRPEYQQTKDELEQVIQSSFANLIALKVNTKSRRKDPSIKSYYYTGGSGHESHTGNHQHHMPEMKTEADIPTLESSLNIKQKTSNINGTFFDLTKNPEDRGYGTLYGNMKDGREFAFYIETDTIQKGDNKIFKHRRKSLTPGDEVSGTKKSDDLTGTLGNDTMIGYQANDKLKGRQGDDQLFGGSGDDELLGGKDDDRLIGRAGENTLKGGGGHDTFVVKGGRNTIVDLNIDRDVIEVPNDQFTIITQGNDSLLTLKSGETTLIVGIDSETLESSEAIQVS